MKLQVPFIQLPVQFDADRLASEMLALGEEAWREHPQKYPGNYALPLVAVDGDPDSDEVAGSMLPTPHLARCPYLMQVLARLGAVWGRTRLMKLAGGAEVSPHVDINYYWRDRMRVHVPIQTQPGVRFQCGEAEVNMRAGECWIFDTWRPHRVLNVADHERVHLVADTVGGPKFWEIANRGRAPGGPVSGAWSVQEFDGYPLAEDAPALEFERTNVPMVMTPWELRDHLQFIVSHVRPDPQLASLQQAASEFDANWRVLWARYGDSRDGWCAYRETLDAFETWSERNAATLRLVNGMRFVGTLRAMILKAALADSVNGGSGGELRTEAGTSGAVSRRQADSRSDFDRPIFIVSPPRSGSSLLFETLAQSPDVCTIGGESHRLIEVETAAGTLGAIARGYASNRLDASDVRSETASDLRNRYSASAVDREGKPPTARFRLLEKTPKNALRVPFLAEVFPNSVFVYLHRDPREVLASMLEAWESGRFRTYPELPGWTGLPWSMVLIPGWRDLIGKLLPDVVAAQWEVTTSILLDDLDALPPGRRCVARYDALVSDPNAEIRRLCSVLDVGWDRVLAAELPSARYTVSSPRRGKWREREREILPRLPKLEKTMTRAADAAGL